MNLVANSDGKKASSGLILQTMDFTCDPDPDIMLLYPDLSKYMRLRPEVNVQLTDQSKVAHLNDLPIVATHDECIGVDWVPDDARNRPLEKDAKD